MTTFAGHQWGLQAVILVKVHENLKKAQSSLFQFSLGPGALKAMIRE